MMAEVFLSKQKQRHTCRGSDEQLLVQPVNDMRERENAVLCEKSRIVDQWQEMTPTGPKEVIVNADAANRKE